MKHPETVEEVIAYFNGLDEPSRMNLSFMADMDEAKLRDMVAQAESKGNEAGLIFTKVALLLNQARKVQRDAKPDPDGGASAKRQEYLGEAAGRPRRLP